MVVLACEPDEGENPFFSLPDAQRNEMFIANYFPEFDTKFDLYLQAKDSYPELILTTAKRNLYEIKERMKRRTAFLGSQEYTLDVTGFEQGKAYTIPGTAKQLDMMDKNTLAIHKQLKESEDLWGEEQKNAQVLGGRGETPAEKGLL